MVSSDLVKFEQSFIEMCSLPFIIQIIAVLKHLLFVLRFLE